MSKIALITGGSSGIGYKMSEYFAKDGYQLLWVSLLAEELQTAKSKLQNDVDGVKIETLAMDLSETTAAQKVLDWTQENNWTVNVLINNAGFGNFGFFDELALEKELSMIQLNVLSLYKLTRLYLIKMKDRNSGTIINISSNSSFQPTPKFTTYASTKAFVTHFSRGLTEELKMQKSNVRVMTVCPSAIKDTAFIKTNQMEGVKTFEGIAATTADEVAKDVWKGFKGNKDFVVTGAKMRLLYKFRHLLPYGLTQWLVRMEVERK